MTTPEQTPERGCLAEEWQRDGRGFWAKRTCRLGPKHKDKHDFWRWEYYAKPPHEIRADAAEAQVAALTATLAHLTQERDAVTARAEEAEQDREEGRQKELDYYREAGAQRKRAEQAEATLARVKAEQLSAEAEQALRQHLWLSHGHRGVYGDDGEMQCGECMPFGMWDYKREPLEKVVFTAIAARHAVNAAALRALVDPPVSSSTETKT